MLVICSTSGWSQTTNPYHINGNASQENCNCYTLTPDLNNQSGSVWNIYKINLQQSFDYKFEIFLGSTDANGADGIAFMLQPVSTSIGSQGGGLGVEGISPSIAVVIDTWQNTINNDPSYDHIAIHRNGNINHGVPDNLAGPVTALATSDNIEDGKWHSLRIIWDATAKTLSAQVDGVDRVKTTQDLVSQIFSGNPEVFWGFTGSTGGSRNHQRFCTSLNPQFTLPAGASTCFPAAIQLHDESRSFGSIVKYFWDFGDGTKDSVAQPVAHSYTSPGIYKVKLQILGNNGCLSDPFEKEITIGSKPVAAFTISPSIPCENDTLQITDSSFVQVGTIDRWSWLIGSNDFSTREVPRVPLSGGNFPIVLTVKTKEGCEAESPLVRINTLPLPSVNFDGQAACINQPLVLEAVNETTNIPIKKYQWKLGNGATAIGSQISYSWKRPGNYMVTLQAFADNGCKSSIVQKEFPIQGTKAFAGNDTIVTRGQPLQLNAQGGDFYFWYSTMGGNDTSSSPKHLINPTRDVSYVLVAFTSLGCQTVDTINIKAYEGPAIYMPSAFTPNGDGRNERFRPVAVGMKSIEVFQVFNRYGQLVYSSRTSEGWDGGLNGSKAPAGTYVWMIGGTDFYGKKHFSKGTVILIR
ncbi:MAG TPA: PKD domain-containing protein [Flavitalea sp.]|nr:PKD domain-containing protein [Flavitalea sp.]